MNMMKKICLLVLIMVLGKLSFSQGYPVTQYIGTDSAVVISRGAMQSRLVNYVYTDTTQANTQRIKAYPGAQIVTTNGGTNFILWIRNQNATRWLQIPAGSGVGNIYTVDGTLTGNRTLLGANNSLTFNQISSLLFRADTTTVTNDGVATLNVKGAIGRVLVVDTTAPVDERIYELKSSNGEFFISKINDAQTLQDSTFYISSGGNIGINTFSPGARLGVNGNTFVKGQLFAGDTALSTYQVEGILTTPYVLGRKAVDTTLSTQARPTGVQGHVVGRGPIANRLQGGTFYATTDSASTANSTGSLRATTSWTAHNGSGTLANAWGSYNIVSNKTTGTITNAYGSVSGVENRGATSTINKLQGSTTEVWNNYGGTIDTAWGQVISIYNNNASSNIGAVYGLSIGRGLITPTGGTHFWRNAGTIGSSYGIYLDSAIDVGTNRFALYSNSYSDSYLKGNLGLGTTTPGGRLAIVDTGGFALKINYNSASSVADSNAALYAENNGTSSYVAILNEKTTNNTGGQYPLLVQSSLLSGTAQAGMATGIHFATPDAQGNKKVTQLALRTTTADSATYSNRAELRLWNNGTLSTPYYLLGNGNMGLGTSTPDSNLTVVNGALFQRGVRMSGLPSAPGTKALRIDASGTISYADTLVDAGGTVTSVATNNGTGITGGTITTTGTLAIDTLLISTRAWRQKGIDSVAALANTKINGSLISGYLTKATGTNTIDTSQIFQSSGLIGIGTTTPTLKLDVNGDVLINGLWAGRGSGNINTNAVLGRLAFNANTTGFQNVAVGNLTLYSNTTGSNNVAIGNSALSANTTANHNVAIGHNSMLSNTTGFQNVAVGIQSLNANTTGESNTAIGTGALASITTGYYNAAIGLASGRYITSGANNTTSNESVYLGYDTRASANGNTNEIVIGGSAQGNGSNSVTLGNSSITKTILRSNVGIGTVTPDSALTVVNGAYFQRGVRMSGLPTGVGTKAVRINANGTLSVADTLANGISGTGTTNYIPKFTSSSAIGNSTIQTDATGNLMVGSSDAGNAGTINVSVGVAGTTAGGLQLWASNSQTHYIQFGDGTTGGQPYAGFLGYAHSADALIFGTATSERMRLTSGGSLGIGTSNPSYKFQVEGGAGYFNLDGSGTTVPLYVNNSSTAAGTQVAKIAFASSGSIKSSIAAAVYGNDYMTFNVGSDTERMRLDASGNLGINTSSPTTKLTIKDDNNNIGTNSTILLTSNNGFATTSYGWDNLNTNYDYSFKVSGSTKMLLDNNGNLGLGTSSPSEKLDVYNNSASNVSIKVGNTSGALQLLQGNGAAYLYTATNQPLIFSNNNSEKMRLDASGNLGIGTSSPIAKLDLTSGLDGTYNSNFIINSNASTAKIAFNPTGGASTGIGSGNGTLLFYTNGANTERMRLDASGNLGLGVTPSAWLSGLYAMQITGVNGIYGAGSSELGLTQNAFFNSSSQWIYGTTNSAGSYQISSGVHKWLIAPSGTAGNAISFTQAMTLDASGRLGIGTTSPTSRLQSNNSSTYNSTTPSGAIIASNLSGTGAIIDIGVDATYLGYIQSRDIASATGYNLLLNPFGGNVGIGTTSPDSALTVQTGAWVKRGLRLSGLPTGIGTKELRIDANGVVYANDTLSNDISGSGTTNYIPKFTSSSAIGNSILYVDGTTLGVNTSAPYLGASAEFRQQSTYDGIYVSESASSRKSISLYHTGSVGTIDVTYLGGGGSYTPLSFVTGGSERMRLDASGNLGLGVTPSAWASFTGLQVGETGSFASNDFGSGNIQTFIGNNVYYDAVGFKYIQAGSARMLRMTSDNFNWEIAGSGSANGAISFTQAMTLDASGRLGIGSTSPSYKLDITALGYGIQHYGNSTNSLRTYAGSGYQVIEATTSTGASQFGYFNGNFFVEAGGSERMRITTAGNVGIGTTSPEQLFTVAGGNISVSGNTGLPRQILELTTASTVSILRASYQGAGSFGDMALWTGGSERMRITSGGNVGIGTSSPTTKLQVDKSSQTIGGTTPNGALVVSSLAAGNGILELGVDPTSLAYIQSRNIASNTLYQLLLNPSGGNVGIGTTSPTYKLVVSNGGALGFEVDPTSSSGGIVSLLTYDRSAGSYKPLQINSEDIRFQTGTVSTERMRITSGGYVGIGTTSPVVGLQVQDAGNTFAAHFSGLNQTNGVAIGTNSTNVATIQGYTRTFSATNNISINPDGGNVGIGTTSPTDILQVNGFSGNGVITIGAGTTGASSVYFGDGTGTDRYRGYIDYYHNGDFFGIGTAATERMRITDAGNVGIGTTSPTSYSGFTTLSINNATHGGVLDLLVNNVRTGSVYTGLSGADFNINAVTNIPMIFSTNNAERMRITSGGNVGIGTSSPNSYAGYTTLTINNGTTGSVLDLDVSDVRTATVSATSSAFYLSSETNIPLIFQTNGAERGRFTAAGELLINTTSDAGDYKLQVNGNSYFGSSSDTYLNIVSTNSAGDAYSIYANTSDANNSYAVGRGNDGSFSIVHSTASLYTGGTLTSRLNINTSGDATFGGSIKTAAPSGGTATTWKLGSKVAATVTLDTANYIEVEVNGVAYKLAIVN